MKKAIFGMIVATLAAGIVNAGESTEASSGSTLATSLAPTLSTMTSACGGNIEDCRQLVDAKDDASEFLATNGQVRSSKLNNALQIVREANPQLQASDIQIAEALLAL